jgi:Mg-chelatase subunit ChlD
MSKNRVAIVLDRSGSMEMHGIWEQAKRETAAMLESLRKAAGEHQQDTAVTIVTFSDTSEVALFQTDVRNPVPSISLGYAGGNTALFDAIAAAADYMRGWQPKNDPDTSYLVLAFTDGEGELLATAADTGQVSEVCRRPADAGQLDLRPPGAARPSRPRPSRHRLCRGEHPRVGGVGRGLPRGVGGHAGGGRRLHGRPRAGRDSR